MWYSAQLNSTTGCAAVTNATDGDANGVNNNCHNIWDDEFAQSLNSVRSILQRQSAAATPFTTAPSATRG